MLKFLWDHNSPYKRLYPSFQGRLFASLVDITLTILVLMPIFFLIHSIVGKSFMMSLKWRIVQQIIQIGFLGAAIFIFWVKKYTTPGKMLLSMKIVDAKTFKDPSIFQLVVRLCSYWVSFLPLGLGIFYMVLNKKRRAWHDLISGTVVVNTRELKKYSNSEVKSMI
ncbi:MAG: RDD family protein [Rickettsiales bacterium]|nr:RDD family protein [Rickettsiales bacterium]